MATWFVYGPIHMAITSEKFGIRTPTRKKYVNTYVGKTIYVYMMRRSDDNPIFSGSGWTDFRVHICEFLSRHLACQFEMRDGQPWK